MDYGAGYWAEGTFEDYLVERDERKKNPGGGPERESEQGPGNITCGTDTG